jgi:hypothetical protein
MLIVEPDETQIISLPTQGDEKGPAATLRFCEVSAQTLQIIAEE